MGLLDNMDALAGKSDKQQARLAKSKEARATRLDRQALKQERRAAKMGRKHLRGGRRARKAEAAASALRSTADHQRSDAQQASAGLKSDALPPAGWYADPKQEQRLRWWDGAQWTDHAAD